MADINYSNGFNYAFLEQRGIIAWIPTSKLYKPSIEGFTYLPEENAYQCRAGDCYPFATTAVRPMVAGSATTELTIRTARAVRSKAAARPARLNAK